MIPTSDETPPVRAVTAEGRYGTLKTAREPFLQRFRDCAKYTLPGLMPPEGTTGSTTLYQPYQSTGADGVNNLSAKMMMVLFPPGQSAFRMTMDDFVVEELTARAGGGQQGEDARARFEEALGKVERGVTNRMEQNGSRKINYEALRHLIVGGNGLIQVLKKARTKFFPLSKYVVKRDLEGDVLEILTVETLARSSLPPEALAIVERHSQNDEEKSEHKSIDLYTWVRRQPSGSWKIHQEICGTIIPRSEGSYPKGKCPFIPLRWTIVPGEDYGRGRCEEYLGDLRSLESLTKSIVEFAAAASKVIIFVNEGGVTEKQQIAEADSGAVLDGEAKDVTVLMLDKSHDFQVAKAVAEETKHRLERAFLMASSVQRQAERVTAEEIRAMVGELEQSLGGVYSILAEEYQRPLVICVMHVMAKEKALPQLPEGAVSPQIVTGLDGLGRSTDLQRLDVLIAGLAQQFGPEAVAEYINIGAYAKRRGTALGIDLSGLVREEQEVQASRQQQQMQQMTEKLGPAGIKAVSDHAMAARQGAPTDATAQ